MPDTQNGIQFLQGTSRLEATARLGYQLIASLRDRPPVSFTLAC
jgi:hypothetical protein